MKTYWDSSALVCALDDDDLRAKLSADTDLCRLHSLAEVFSTLTGGRLGYRVPASKAAQQVEELSESVTLVELKPMQVFSALKEAERRGVRGGRVHDYLHAVAAKHSGAERLLTLDRNDFEGLADGLEIVQLEHPPVE